MLETEKVMRLWGLSAAQREPHVRGGSITAVDRRWGFGGGRTSGGVTRMTFANCLERTTYGIPFDPLGSKS